ncbi:MAG: efflux RND transporter periplasmic adaptor subunit [Sulfuricella sp.]|nr:efflux RND transporter periplasmic adaptor subunit [Sulfuricella sp.]
MSQSDNPATPALPDYLQAGKGSGKLRRRLGAALGLLVLGGGVLWLSASGGKTTAGQYVTEEAGSGKLVVTVSATGTLQPTKSVDVGSELSGVLEDVLVEENDRVSQGQVLARLDTSKLLDQVARSRAAVAAAEASVAQAQATLAETRANLARFKHVAELSGGKAPAQTELDAAEAALLRAVANQASAEAAVAQARATLKSDETNIRKAVIRSPVDGVVLTRKVEPGQTLVAAMTTPTLFVLAENLKRMELQIKVDEADVSTVQLGQPASFSVSAWPKRRFPATIMRVGMGSTTTDNVVTYKTILKVANDDLALRPGMTATAEIITANREKALMVPNAALRFTPPQVEQPKSESLVASLLPRPPKPRQRPNVAPSGSTPQVWVLRDGQPLAVPVKSGVSNGRHTEILEGDLKPGTPVITEYQETRK